MSTHPLAISLRQAVESDLPALLPLVTAYHTFEEIDLTEAQNTAALLPLLRDPSIGLVWFICEHDQPVGYMAICYSYSIEYGGRDCFLDELFIADTHRGQGIGPLALSMASEKLAADGVRTMLLEVAHGNPRAQKTYTNLGFQPRDRYILMSRML